MIFDKDKTCRGNFKRFGFASFVFEGLIGIGILCVCLVLSFFVLELVYSEQDLSR